MQECGIARAFVSCLLSCPRPAAASQRHCATLVGANLAQRTAEPLETLVETIARRGAGRLDVPGALSQAVEAELVCDFRSVHGVLFTGSVRWSVLSLGGSVDTYRQILLVGKDQEHGVTQLILVQHALKLLTGLDNTVAIVAVDNENDALGVLEVVPPQRADLVLPTNIPHGELDVLVFNGLDVEACGNSQYRLATFEKSAGDAPIVGMVVTISPSLSLYRIVVFPAASRPTIKIRISFLPHSLSKSFEKVRPILSLV